MNMMMYSLVLKAPEGSVMQLDFTDFNVPADSNENCPSYVEIKHWYPAFPGKQWV